MRPDPEALYPDVAVHGSLAAALRAVAAKQGSSLPADESASDPLCVATVAGATPHRTALVVNAWHFERRWAISGTGTGGLLVEGSTLDLADVARAAEAWRDGVPLDELERIAPFIERTGRLEVLDIHDPAQLTESEWGYFLADARRSNSPEYRALIEAAHAEPRLRQLFPHTIMQNLTFSTFVESPLTADLPRVTGWRGRYVVVSPRLVFITETTTAEEAVAVVASWLPDDAGPARAGVGPRRYPPVDPLRDEVERRCDLAAPRHFWTEDMTEEHWRSLLDYGADKGWWTLPADGATPPTTVEGTWGRMMITFHLTSPSVIAFDVDVRRLDPEDRWYFLEERLIDIMRATGVRILALTSSADDPAHPVLALRPYAIPAAYLLSAGDPRPSPLGGR